MKTIINILKVFKNIGHLMFIGTYHFAIWVEETIWGTREYCDNSTRVMDYIDSWPEESIEPEPDEPPKSNTKDYEPYQGPVCETP